MQPHHHHPGDPEEDDVEAGDQDVGRIVALQLRRLVGPAQGRERPQRRGEPGVEHVLVAAEGRGQPRTDRGRAPAPRPRSAPRAPRRRRAPPRRPRPRSPRRSSRPRANTRPGSGVPTRADARRTRAECSRASRNRSSPRSSARTGSRPSRTALERRRGQRLGVDVPLIGEPRLDHGVRAVAVRDHVRVRFDPRQKAGERHHLDDALPGDETVLTVDARRSAGRGHGRSRRPRRRRGCP